MKNAGKEFLVGCLVLLAVALMVVFGWLMGAIGPFASEVRYHLLFGFAGGVEVGSPVRVSGVKVGKVEKIEFLPEVSEKDDDRVTLRLTISVAKRAAPSIRRDSKFFVNMAGIIGERYIEISPGSLKVPVLPSGSVVRGVDPPRIDQLLSQGYSVFGRIQDFLEENESTIQDFLKQFHGLLVEANDLLKGKDRKKLMTMIENFIEITQDVKGVTKKLQDPNAKEFFEKLLSIIRKADQVDKEALKKFLQQEGVRAHIF